MPSSKTPIRRYRILEIVLISVLYGVSFPAFSAKAFEFNTDVLDVEDRKNIDLEQFSRVGYIMPGTYTLNIKVNDQSLSEMPVTFYSDDEIVTGSVACLSPAAVEQIGLNADSRKKLTWWHDGECLETKSLEGLAIIGDISTSSLYVNVPQAYLEYNSPDWDPPTRWDNGISALILDYNISGNFNRNHKDSHKTSSLSGNGVTGINLGAWRIRGDWQTQANHTSGDSQATNNEFKWSRFYAYRAISALRAKLIVGEDYLDSAIFDSFRFIGARLHSDLNMIPPNLRGYAPEIMGVAKTNATVTVSQQGRVIYETQVAQGPFRIQDLNDATSGKLEVTVTEQDGSIQKFDVDTANLPFLTRPGQVQYKLAVGQPMDYDRHSEGENFASGEFSWGVSNGWSLFGGLLASKNYQAISAGIGRDLLAFGALSFDITQSRAQLPENSNITGGSYRISYSKRFEEYDSQVTFAGYRFSERDFMSMSDFLTAKRTGVRYGNNKEMYTISVNKNFVDSGLSLYLNYNHQTYWDRPGNDYYSVMLSKYFDLGSLKNISASLSANRQVYNGTNDDSLYLSLSLPWGASGNIGYSLDMRRNDINNRASYYDTLNDRTSYQVSVGNNRSGATTSGFLSYQGDNTALSANASYANNQYSAIGFNATGGMTLTPEGGALHRSSLSGGTRLLVDTDGVSEVPIRAVGAPIKTNAFGKAVISDMSSYYRTQVQIDLNNLPDNVDAEQSVVQATLTEGAVGYRRFNVLAGQKAMILIRLSDGSYPPFGAQVKNQKGQNTGIVGDSGNAYISGINSDEVMNIDWGEESQCQITFPKVLDDMSQALLVPCISQGKA